MRDHQLGYTLPFLPLGEAIDDDFYAADAAEERAHAVREFERYSRPAFFTTNPAEWKRGNPPEVGWYIVGSLKDRYSATIRCHFDGEAWGEWVGLVNPDVRGIATADKWTQYEAKWFRKCLPLKTSRAATNRRSNLSSPLLLMRGGFPMMVRRAPFLQTRWCGSSFTTALSMQRTSVLARGRTSTGTRRESKTTRSSPIGSLADTGGAFVFRWEMSDAR